MAKWTNADGLTIKYGADEIVDARVTEYTSDGPKRWVEVILDSTDLGGVVTLDSYKFMKDSTISGYKVAPGPVAFAGGTNVKIDLVEKDGTVDETVATLTLAQLNAQTEADVNLKLDEITMIKLTPTGTFTAGKTSLIIYFEVPKTLIGDTLVWDKSNA